jgi:hypothetical protein
VVILRRIGGRWEHRRNFWAEAAEVVDWEKRWDSVRDDSRAPFYRWFAGALLTLVMP